MGISLKELKERIKIPDLFDPERAEALRRGEFITCPLHANGSEKTASFHLVNSDDLDHFKCFGCGVTGDIIDLYGARNHLDPKDSSDFKTIIREIQPNGEAPPRTPPSKPAPSKPTSPPPDPVAILKRMRILEHLTQFCERELQADTTIARQARAYLQRRHWPEDLLKRMRVGLVDILRLIAAGFTDEELRLVGLINANGKHILSKPRIFYPVIVDCEVIHATTGKLLDSDRLPKYMTLADTIGVIPSNFFLNHNAVNTGELIISEGVSDTLTLISWGQNAAGVLGAQMRPKPDVLKDIYKVTIAFDNDEAGRSAATEYAKQLGAVIGSENVRILCPPDEWHGKPVKDWSDMADAGATTQDFEVLLSAPPTNPPKKLSSEENMTQNLTPQVPQDNPGKNRIIFSNRRKLHLALDYYTDDSDGKPTLLYTTWILKGTSLNDAQDIPYYLIMKPGEPPRNGEIEYLDIPKSSKQNLPYPTSIHWDNQGEYSFEEFLEGPKIISAYDIYTEIIGLFTEFMYFPDAAEFDLLAGFIMSTYLYPLFGVTPYIHLIGDGNCGKSTCLHIIQDLSFNAMSLMSASEAQLVRAPADNRCTAFFDEAGRWRNPTDGTPAAAQLDVLRSGYKPGSEAIRYDGFGSNKTDRRLPNIFDHWCPKVFGSRVELDLNLADRFLVINCLPAPSDKLDALRILAPQEVEYQRRVRNLRNRLHTWAFSNFDKVWETLPKFLAAKPFTHNVRGRDLELWTPILTIGAFIDQSKDPDQFLFQGNCYKSLVRLMAKKLTKSHERIIVEDSSLLYLEKIIEVIEEGTVEIRTQEGITWYSGTSLCSKINENLAEAGNINTVSPKKIAGILRAGYTYTGSRQITFSSGKRAMAHAINIQELQNKITAIKRSCDSPQPEDYQSTSGKSIPIIPPDRGRNGSNDYEDSKIAKTPY